MTGKVLKSDAEAAAMLMRLNKIREEYQSLLRALGGFGGAGEHSQFWSIIKHTIDMGWGQQQCHEAQDINKSLGLSVAVRYAAGLNASRAGFGLPSKGRARHAEVFRDVYLGSYQSSLVRNQSKMHHLLMGLRDGLGAHYDMSGVPMSFATDTGQHVSLVVGSHGPKGFPTKGMISGPVKARYIRSHARPVVFGLDYFRASAQLMEHAAGHFERAFEELMEWIEHRKSREAPGTVQEVSHPGAESACCGGCAADCGKAYREWPQCAISRTGSLVPGLRQRKDHSTTDEYIASMYALAKQAWPKKG